MKKTDSSTVVSFGDYFAKKHPESSRPSREAGGDGPGSDDEDQFLLPSIHAYIALHYLEIVGEHPDVSRELSISLKNSFFSQAKIQPYLIISQRAHDVLTKISLGVMQVKAMEAAVRQIKEICGDVTHHV